MENGKKAYETWKKEKDSRISEKDLKKRKEEEKAKMEEEKKKQKKEEASLVSSPLKIFIVEYFVTVWMQVSLLNIIGRRQQFWTNKVVILVRYLPELIVELATTKNLEKLTYQKLSIQ